MFPVCSNPSDASTCTQIQVPDGGRQLLIINSELRIPVPITFPSPINRNLGFAAFYDGGNVFPRLGFHHFAPIYSNSIGIGLRYSTPLGPVRIDVGHNLNAPPGIKSTAIFHYPGPGILSALPQPPFSGSRQLREVPKQSRRPPARWKHLLAWTGGILGGLIILLVFGVYVLLHSARVHAYVLRTVQAKAGIALGSDVRLRDYGLRWSGINPTLELYDVSISGAPPYADSSLLRADSLRVGVTISSLWHRSWYVNDIQIQRPVIHVLAYRDGQTNLPHPPSGKSSSGNFDIFQLGVRHLALQQGEIYYNNQKSDLAADLHDLAVQIGFAVSEKKYSGTLSYRDGHVTMDRT